MLHEKKCDAADEQETKHDGRRGGRSDVHLEDRRRAKGFIGHVSQDDEVTRDSRTCLAAWGSK